MLLFFKAIYKKFNHVKQTLVMICDCRFLWLKQIRVSVCKNICSQFNGYTKFCCMLAIMPIHVAKTVVRSSRLALVHNHFSGCFYLPWMVTSSDNNVVIELKLEIGSQ